MDEGIFHNGGTAFTVETGQWRYFTGTGGEVHLPPDSLLGVNFTLFGKLKPTSGVARTITVSSDSMTIQLTNNSSRLTVNFAVHYPTTQCNLQLYDVLCHPLRSQDVGAWDGGWHTMSFDVGEFPTGYYVVRLVTPTGIVSEPFLLTR